MAKIVVLNGQRVNYDGLVDYSVLGADVAVYDHSTPEEILPRLAGAEIAVTKELVLTEEQVLNLPDSVKLICEAGTGYNNIPPLFLPNSIIYLTYCVNRYYIKNQYVCQ